MSIALSARKLWLSGLLVAAVGATVAVGSAQAQGMDRGMDHGMGPGMHHAAMQGGPGMDRGMGHGMGMPMMGGRMLDRMLDMVNATDAQRTQIRQITDAARKDMQAQHESGRALHEEAMKLFTQPTIDARAAEGVRQKMLAQHDAASKRGMQAMLDVSAVLTPDQRKQMADKMAQRRAMMERHHQERQQIEGAPR